MFNKLTNKDIHKGESDQAGNLNSLHQTQMQFIYLSPSKAAT